MAVERMTIAEIAEQTGADPKSLRAYLRRNFKRENERKGSRWGDAKSHQLTKTQTGKLLEQYTPEAEAEAS